MSLRHTILGVLDWIPMHGYALREMTRHFGWIQPMANVNLYPTLRELEGEGLVRHLEEVHGGRLRKIYSVTEAGRAELRRWLTSPELEPRVFRDPVLLRVCMLRPGTHAGASAWIAAELERTAGVLADAERWLEEHGRETPKYSRLVAEFGRGMQELRVRWLERVLAEARRDASAEPC